MAVFYILSPDRQLFELSATTEVAVSYTGSPTQFKVEDGSTIADNYVINNTTASFNGLITSVQGFSNQENYKTPKEYLEGLRRLMLSKQPFTVYVDNRLSPLRNCLFTNIDISKDVETGLSGWLCRMSFEQVRVEQRAKASTLQIKPSVESVDTTASKDDVGNTQGKDATSKTLLRSGFDLLGRANKEVGSLGSGI